MGPGPLLDLVSALSRQHGGIVHEVIEEVSDKSIYQMGAGSCCAVVADSFHEIIICL